jgi:probable HAF family extracellular repeat protein
MGLSANGSEAFRWTEAGGLVGLGDRPGGGFSSEAHGVSADGGVIVGWGDSGETNGSEAFRWTAAGGLVGLGDLPGGVFTSEANGVSADGRVIVGQGFSANGPEAFRWTEAGGLVGLGDPPGGWFYSTAHGVSADGRVIVGMGLSANGSEAFRWTEAGGLVGLGDRPGGNFNSYADGVSADGGVIVGRGESANGFEAFRWTEAGGLVGLGDLPGGGFSSEAHGVSADGGVIVGLGLSANGAEASVWEPTQGMRTLREVLVTEYGLGTQLSGWVLVEATAVTPDGRVIVGTGINPTGQREAFRVQLKAAPRPPVLAPIGAQQVNEDTRLTFQASASDPDSATSALRFSLAPADAATPLPAGVTIDPLTGDFAWTPTEAQGPGTYYLNVFVRDETALVDWQTVQITVDEVPDPAVGAFQGLGDLSGGQFYSKAYGISADGSTVVGQSVSGLIVGATDVKGPEGFRWTVREGMQGLGDVAGGSFGSSAHDVSGDGTFIAGWVTGETGQLAARWDAGGWFPVDRSPSDAAAISQGGETLVGAVGQDAARWFIFEGAGGETLGPGRANDVSADGSLVVGAFQSSGTTVAFRWTPTAGGARLGFLPGGSSSTANGVSTNGEAIVGVSTSANGTEAFLRAETINGPVMTGLGDLPGGAFFSAANATSDGQTIVGSGTTGNGQEAFVWDPTNGMRNLKDVLETQYGLSTRLVGWTLVEATDVTPDGNSIVGWGINPAGQTEAWVAHLNIILN